MVYSANNDLYIDVDEAIYLESIDGNYHSYTFPILRAEDSDLTENLLLSLNIENSYDAYIISYNLSQSEKELLLNNEFVDLEDKTTIEAIENFDPDTVLNKTLYVYADTVSGEVTCWEMSQGTSQGTGDDIVEFTATDCPWDVGAGGGDGSPPTFDYSIPPSYINLPDYYSGSDITYLSGSNYGGNDGNDNGNGPTSSPFILTPEQEYLKKFKLNLSSSYFNWINDLANEEKSLALHTYLLNYYSFDIAYEDNLELQQAEAFVNIAIETWLQGGSVDIDDQIVIKPEFEEDYPCHSKIVMDAINVCSDFNIEFLNAFESNQNYYVNYNHDTPSNTNGLPSTSLANTVADLNCTDPICNIDITFNNQYFDSMTNIALATATIHENMHAMLYFLWHSQQIDTLSDNPSYAELSQAYCNHLAENSGLTNYELELLIHQYMVEHVSSLAQTLKNYAQSIGLTLSDEYCVKLMWNGTLTTLPTYNYEYDYDERFEIWAIGNAEKLNELTTYELSNGRTKTITPSGSNISSSNPCN